MDAVSEAYIELLKRALTNELFKEFEYQPLKRNNPLRRALHKLADGTGVRLTSSTLFTDENRRLGKGVTPMALTSIGRLRIDNLHYCIRTAIEDDIPGDAIETGVWRGGATIFMRGAFNAYRATDRTVWVADSFEGLPPPDPNHPADAGSTWHLRSELAVSIEEVQANFERYDLTDGVKYLKGWFKDTLPTAPIEKLAVARLDGDMYSSTMDALNNLYDKVSPGGFILIDDYSVHMCKTAVDEFRAERKITDPLEEVDWTGVYWRKSG
ncbi:MAG: TylF/MycF/NovP-related O-methyltransferase [Fimbriimonas sp.]